MEKLNGWIRGAVNSYVTGIMVLFALLLSYNYQSEGFGAFSNNILFQIIYITPLAFITDWFLTEKSRYKWGYIKLWMIYPYAYIGFAVIHGKLTGN